MEAAHLPPGVFRFQYIRDMQWFKFYGGEYLSDPKMLALAACHRSCWITLLSYACVADNGGQVNHLTEYNLMIQSGIAPQDYDWDYCVGVLKKFVDLGMIKIDSNGVISICNWNKRQETYLTNAERQKRFRDKQKRNADVTLLSNDSNARREENRIETTSAIAPITLVKDEPAPKTSKAKYPHKKEVFALWGKYPRNWEVNSTQCAAAENLYLEHGVEGTKKALAFLAEHEGEAFLPEVSSPYELDSKWAKIIKWRNKQ